MKENIKKRYNNARMIFSKIDKELICLSKDTKSHTIFII